MMKPLMMKVFTDDLDTQLDWRQKAIAVASHNGDAQHVAAAQSILSEEEWGFMQTPLDVPLVQFGRQVRRPRRWFHTCSGEHAALLAGCREKDWEQVGYMLPHHPFFHAYLQQVRRFLARIGGRCGSRAMAVVCRPLRTRSGNLRSSMLAWRRCATKTGFGKPCSAIPIWWAASTDSIRRY